MKKTYTFNDWQLCALSLLLLTTGGVMGYSEGRLTGTLNCVMQSSTQDRLTQIKQVFSIITQLRRELGYEEEYNRIVTDEAAAAQKRVLVLEHELATQKTWRDLEQDSEATPVVDAMVNRMMPDIYAAMGIPTWLRPAPTQSHPTTLEKSLPPLPDPY